MANYRQSVITNSGLNYARQADNGLIKITFTRGVLSSEDHSEDTEQQLESLISLNAFVQSDSINYTNALNLTDVMVPLRFRNNNQTSNNYVDTIGLYATDGTTEVLYSIIINDDPDLFPAFDGSNVQSIKINYQTQVGRASQVNAELNPLGMVTEEELSAATQNWELSSSHASDVASLSAEISNVSSAIANNSGIASEFSEVNTEISNNSNAAVGLQNQINNNNKGLWNEINQSINPSVATNSTGISKLSTSVATNSTEISTLSTSVATNSTAIDKLSSNVANNNNSQSLASSVATNSSNIAALSGSASNGIQSNGSNFVNLQNTVNGVLARQSLILSKGIPVPLNGSLDTNVRYYESSGWSHSVVISEYINFTNYESKTIDLSNLGVSFYNVSNPDSTRYSTSISNNVITMTLSNPQSNGGNHWNEGFTLTVY